MPISNQRDNGKPISSQIGRGGDSEGDANEPITEPRSNYSIYVNLYYHLRSTWMLWYLIGKKSKEKYRKTDDFNTAPTRVDSGFGLHLLGQDLGQLSRPNASTPPSPISLTFIFEDGTITKNLDYSVYSQWTRLNALLSVLALDGVIVDELWDINEDMQISGGDWDARIQPGSAIDAWCFDDKLSYHSDDIDDSSDCDSDDETVESGGDGDDIESEYRMGWKSPAKNTRNEHTWWFARWRQRVEKAIPGRHEVTDEPPWLFIVVWCTTTITIIALLILLNQ